MIKLERKRHASAITSGLRGKSRVEKAILLLQGKLNNSLELKSDYWKAAKKQLKAESNGKCAYCEAPTSSVAHGDVEHFRPKSIYWWLAYCYDNYLYSCQICNESYKGTEFPISAKARLALEKPLPAKMTQAEIEALAPFLAPDPLNDAEGYPISKFTKLCVKEKAGLVDPYMFDPEPFFKWVADPVLKEVSIGPRNNKTGSKRAFDAVNKFLGLNREELRRERWKTYKYLETFKQTLVSDQLSEALRDTIKEQVAEMLSDASEFAGMARYFVRVEWKASLKKFGF
jgi:hypothetical protein